MVKLSPLHTTTALHYVLSKTQDIAVIKLLLQYNASLSITNTNGFTPWSNMIFDSNMPQSTTSSTLNYLLTNHRAQMGDIDHYIALDLPIPDFPQVTVLSGSFIKGFVDISKLLLTHGASLDSYGDKNVSPFLRLIQFGTKEANLLEYVLNNYINNIFDWESSSLWIAAADNSHSLKTLIKYNVDITTRHPHHGSLLHCITTNTDNWNTWKIL